MPHDYLMMDKTELAKRIYGISHLTGYFTLRSGQVSDEYFDKYLFESDPQILTEIAQHMSELIPEGTEVLGGLELGGIPLATALSLETGIPVAFVRKKAKSYGTKNLAEGVDVRGKKVCIIEDVTSTGGQIVESVSELRKLGATVDTVLCVIIRDHIADENLKNEGMTLAYLYDMEDLRS